jgi:hypothetical protein
MSSSRSTYTAHLTSFLRDVFIFLKNIVNGFDESLHTELLGVVQIFNYIYIFFTFDIWKEKSHFVLYYMLAKYFLLKNETESKVVHLDYNILIYIKKETKGFEGTNCKTCFLWM